MLEASFKDSWQFCLTNAGNPQFTTTDGVGYNILIDPYQLPVDEWHHVAMTWDSGSRAKQLFMDGAPLRGSVGATVAFDSGPMVFGTDLNANTPGGWFFGRLDDFRLYDRALSPSEIAALAL
jgi:hypothetical protein